MTESRCPQTHPGNRAAVEQARAPWAKAGERTARARNGRAAAEAPQENAANAGMPRPRLIVVQPAHPARTITVEQARAAFLEVAAERRQARLARRKARQRAAARATSRASGKC